MNLGGEPGESIGDLAMVTFRISLFISESRKPIQYGMNDDVCKGGDGGRQLRIRVSYFC